MAEEKKPEGSEKFDEFERKAKEALDQEADKIRVRQVLADQEMTEEEMEQIGHEEGFREHFTGGEEEE